MQHDDYRLDAELLQSIFDKSIAPSLFGNDVSASETPHLVLIGAQPGAGKTFAGESVAEAQSGTITPIVGDDMRLFHPAYRHLLDQSPADMPAATAQASSAWVEMAIDYAIAHHLSVLVEGTFRRPELPLDTAARFSAAGLRTQAVLVTVPPEVSRASIASRFVDDHSSGQSARFTPLEAHDIAFDALPATVRALTAAGAPIDRFTVMTRTTTIFDKGRNGHRGMRGALKAATAEWNRPLDGPERSRVVGQINSATRYLSAAFRGDKPAELLVSQLVLDQEYIELSVTAAANGKVAVRGHTRDGYQVRPRTRPRPHP